MVNFEKEFAVKSIYKTIYMITEGLDYREEIEENEIIFIFQKSEESQKISDNYKKMLNGENIMVNLTKYKQVTREINNKISEYRKNR